MYETVSACGCGRTEKHRHKVGKRQAGTKKKQDQKYEIKITINKKKIWSTN